MTISSTNRKAGPYTGNDVAVDFPFSFKVFSASDLYVVQANALGAETVLVLTTDYTVSLNADQNANPGGTISLLSPLATGFTLSITSSLQYLQATDLTNNGGFYPKVITNALDRLTIFVQQLAEQLSRSLKYSITAPLSDSTLPAPVANNVIGWNSDANGFQNYAPVDNTLLSAALASSAGSSLVGYLPSGTGAVATDVQSKLRESVSVKDFGADPAASAAVNTAAIQAALAANQQNTVIDFGGKTFQITSAITLQNTTNIKLINGTLVQTTEAQDVLRCEGTYHTGLVLDGISLEHTFNTSAAGSCFVVASTVTNFNFFKWDGGHCLKGFYGIRTNGSVWMASFERVWVLSPRSSGWYMPASGSVVNNSQLGGSTTTKLYKCFVTDVQTDAPAYAIGSGYDTVILEHCSADRCYKFGYFKANPLHILNCSSENVINPPTGVVAGPHRFINIESGAATTFDGFHVVFDPAFISPAPGGGNVNSLLYAINPANLSLSGLRGAVPSGYYTLDQSGGVSLVNSSLLGSGVRTVYGAISKSVLLIPDTPRPNRTALSGVTGGNAAPTDLWSFESGDNTYILYTSWSFGGQTSNSTWLVYTSSSESKGVVTKLMSGPDFATSVTISLVGTAVRYTTTSNLNSTWKAFKLSLSDY